MEKENYNLRPIEYVILSGALTVLVCSIIQSFDYQECFEKLRMERMQSTTGQMLIYFGLTILILKLSFLAYLLILHLKYKVIKTVSDEKLPTLTVIVPAYNEGELVYHTLKSLANSNYPTEKLEILAIDDGSKDDTWSWMQKAKSDLGSRVQIFQQPENKGKRHALYRGFNIGKGEIFVTVDSDSVVLPDTLRLMASPFVTNEDCGAVAGNVKVLNSNKTSIIPKMLNVSFAFSFEFVRSAQSSLGSVLCTPGALSAYRKTAVMNCLEDWINQTFMGEPSDIGEDRTMTNMILKQGYNVLFQRNAVVYTDTPERFKNLYKMFIRWERSNVRENIMMSKFAFKNFRKGPKMGTRILLLNQWFRLLLSIPATILMFTFIVTHPLLFLTSTFSAMLVYASIQTIFYAKRNSIVEAFWAYPYSIFYAFTLFWITPYAIATANKRGWLTREIK